jgi:DNA repair protein RecN (Recombination protein N)
MAFELSGKRSAAVAELQDSIESELANLAMPRAEFRVAVEYKESAEGLIEGPDGRRYDVGPGGVDRVEFRLKTDPGAQLLPLHRVASGGEVSRIMLALKSVFGKASRVPTLVFDEIDSGIGGVTADRVGEKLSTLADEHQVLVITHLPQIARRGDLHLVVEKEVDSSGARARIRRVVGEERTQALAVLMSGEAESEAVLDHARELLGVSNDGEGEE